MPKILFIVPHRPNRSPSQRFRFEQYLSYIKQNGFDYDYSYLINEKDDKVFYSHGHIAKKTLLNIKFILQRIKDVSRAKHYDIVFIQREALFLGTAIFEKLFSRHTKVIFDFDDAIWLPNVSLANKKFLWLKNPSKVKTAIKSAHHIIAGNKYLADYAKQYNNNTTIIPTTIDTNTYKYHLPTNKKQVCIGWTGSSTTIKHLSYILPILETVQKKYGNKVCIKIISDIRPSFNNIEFEFTKWKASSEVEDLLDIDFGIMPLPDNKWTRGKCGLKALQYMAIGRPAIVSPVGVNTEIVQHNYNGLVANSKEEWLSAISYIIDDYEMRLKLGKNARKTVEQYYSVDANKNKYLEVFNSLI